MVWSRLRSRKSLKRQSAQELEDACILLDERFAEMKHHHVAQLSVVAADGWTVDETISLARLWPRLDSFGLAVMLSFAQRLRRIFGSMSPDIGLWTLALWQDNFDGTFDWRAFLLDEIAQRGLDGDELVEAVVTMYRAAAKTDRLALIALAAGQTPDDIASQVANSLVDERRLRELAWERGIPLL